MDIESSDGELMAALRSGDDLALNALMDRHGEKLFHYLIRLTQSESDAAELAQETFVRIFEHRNRFRANARFTTWLYTIATNLARDRLRRLTRHPHLSLEAEPPHQGGTLGDLLESSDLPPDARLQQEERILLVRQAIANLPEEHRTPLILSEYEDFSQAEIANVLGCSIKAVENRLYRARQSLRKHLTGTFKSA
jgi:RNA polymerase sigma-70 factor, ECF subfamily